MLALLSLIACSLAQGMPDLPRLRVGETLRAEISDSAPSVKAPALDARLSAAPVSGKSFRIELGQDGPYTIELRSHFFDSYLVLRDESGNTLAEEDGGSIGRHALLVLEDFKPGAGYRIDACALDGGRGAFELTLSAGSPQALSPVERAAAEVADAEKRTEALASTSRGESAEMAEALAELGRSHAAQGRYAAAKQPAERALAISEKANGPEHPATAARLVELAELLSSLGELSAARPLLERALAIRQKAFAPDDINIAQSLNNLGLLIFAQGDFDGARTLLERAHSIYEQNLGADHLWTGASFSNLGALLHAQGNLEGARRCAERAVAIWEARAPDDPDTAKSLWNLALIHRNLGDLEAAQQLYERALAVYERVLGPEHPATASCLIGFSMLLAIRGDYSAARSIGLRSLAIQEKALEPGSPEIASSLGVLANVLYEVGDYGQARAALERALAIQERVLGPEHFETATTIGNLGVVLEALGEANALELQERGLATFMRACGSEHPGVAMRLNNVGFLLYRRGDYRSACNYYESALAISERAFGPEHPHTATYLGNLALLRADMGEFEAAWNYAHRAQAKLEQSRRLLSSLSEAESYRHLASELWRLETQLSLAPLVDRAEVQVEAYEALLAWKGQVGRLLIASRAQLLARMSSEQRELIESLRMLQDRISRLAFSPSASAEHADQLADLTAERNRIEAELQRSEGGQGDERLSFADIASTLPPRSALLDFFVHRSYRPARWEGARLAEKGAWSDPMVSVWITRSGSRAPVRLSLGSALVLERIATEFLEGLVRHRGAPATAIGDAGSSAALREHLWDPIEPHLDGVESAFVSPDGFLGTLPLEVIPEKEGRFLVERYAFSYCADAASLARTSAPLAPEGPARLLSVGGVDFQERLVREKESSAAESAEGSRGGFSQFWGKLPHTAYEAQIVADLFETAHGGAKARLLRGSEATEERIRAELPHCSNVHIATHGFFQPQGLPSLWTAARVDAQKARENQPSISSESREIIGEQPGLLSGLVCAGANLPALKGQQDGYLTAEEVGWLDLSKVDLVVLSACETGLGRTQSGEGMLGLRRAFHTAGARTVVSSLWSVRDESTSELMQAFYGNLWRRGMGKRDALRAAQLEMLAKNRARGNDAFPSTWGAFVLSGDWR